MASSSRRAILLTVILAGLGIVLWLRSPDLEPEPGAAAPIPPPVAAAPEPEGPAMEIAPAEASEAGRRRDDNLLGMGFRYCPPGAFHLGKSARPTVNQPAAIRVVLERGYWMGEAEVNQGQWLIVMGTTLKELRAKSPQPNGLMGDGSSRDDVGLGPDRPIYFVSFLDAREFCQRFTSMEREARRLPQGMAYRLPTEAEWEYACRAGTTTASSFGDRLGGDDANIDGTKPYGNAPIGPYAKEVTPSGRYAANAWGLFDMHGNLWEWCFDTLLAESNAPTGPPDWPRCVIRGGCWHNPGAMCLSTTRYESIADHRGSGIGFRVVLAAEDAR